MAPRTKNIHTYIHTNGLAQINGVFESTTDNQKSILTATIILPELKQRHVESQDENFPLSLPTTQHGDFCDRAT
jgi:hypothetical protein